MGKRSRNRISLEWSKRGAVDVDSSCVRAINKLLVTLNDLIDSDLLAGEDSAGPPLTDIGVAQK